MKKKVVVSILASIGILVGGLGVAYAAFTFKANQTGFRQAGEGQAAEITMRVEAGMADANSDLVPDDFYNPTGSPGGALSFSIHNTSDVPLQIQAVDLATYACGTAKCNAVGSNKNTDGTFAYGGGGTCSQYVKVVAPASFVSWPTLAPNGTLEVNGTDGNHLGAGMLHLKNETPQGCQGATFAVGLNVTAIEVSTNPYSPVPQP